MEPVEYKLLEKLTPEQKFEIATRALCDITKEMAFQELRLLELVDRLEAGIRRFEGNSKAEAIRQELERRESQRRQGGGARENFKRKRN